MKRIAFILLSIGFFCSAFGQQSKVAVFDPKDDANTGMVDIVREMLSTGLTNTSTYTCVERAMIDRVLKENQYQSTGMVEDSKLSELGKQMGADFVCVSMIQPMGNNYFVTAKLVDVTTAAVKVQKYVRTINGKDDLFEKIEELMAALTGGKQSNSSSDNTKVPTVEHFGETYMVMPRDMGKASWDEAKIICENSEAYGYNDWKLSDKPELNTLYQNKDKIGGFKVEYYWNSAEVKSDGNRAWCQGFGGGKMETCNKLLPMRVCCVRKK